MAIVLDGTTGITTPDIDSTQSTLGPLTQALNLGSTGQIVFPATQNASSNANTLDDYEEGAWTPVLGGSGGQSGQGYTRQAGRYVKIGRLVICSFAIILSTKGTITGDAQIQGLPFTVANDGANDGRGNRGGLSLGFYGALGTNVVFLGGFAVENQTYVNFYHTTAANSTTSPIAGSSLFANGTDLNGSFVYITA
jgi:hypothetical protein